MPCTQENFRDFCKARAYDIIGEGSFRKHMGARKDAGDPWAIQMTHGIHAVIADTRRIHSMITQLHSTFPLLGQICKHVVIAAHPPIKVAAVQTTCAITHQRCSNCLCLPGGTKGSTVYVHLRFCRFFAFLWFACKIEYVIRCFIRCWVQKNTHTQSLQSLAEGVSDMDTDFGNLYTFFLLSSSHIENSISKILQSQTESIIKSDTNT